MCDALKHHLNDIHLLIHATIHFYFISSFLVYEAFHLLASRFLRPVWGQIIPSFSDDKVFSFSIFLFFFSLQKIMNVLFILWFCCLSWLFSSISLSFLAHSVLCVCVHIRGSRAAFSLLLLTFHNYLSHFLACLLSFFFPRYLSSFLSSFLDSYLSSVFHTFLSIFLSLTLSLYLCIYLYLSLSSSSDFLSKPFQDPLLPSPSPSHVWTLGVISSIQIPLGHLLQLLETVYPIVKTEPPQLLIEVMILFFIINSLFFTIISLIFIISLFFIINSLFFTIISLFFIIISFFSIIIRPFLFLTQHVWWQWYQYKKWRNCY